MTLDIQVPGTNIKVDQSDSTMTLDIQVPGTNIKVDQKMVDQKMARIIVFVRSPEQMRYCLIIFVN